MGWTGVVTDAGRELFANYATSGLTLSIDTVKAGSGSYSSASEMRSATALNSLKDAGAGTTSGSQTMVEKKSAVSDGIQFRMRVGAAPASVGVYTLTEIGLFVNASDGTTTTSTMVAYYQTDNGVDIPLASTFPDFAFILSSVLLIDNTIPISLTVDSSTFVSSTDFQDAVDALEAAVAAKMDENLGSGNAGKFLTVAQDGSVVPESITMIGATSSADGKSGLVPQPLKADRNKYLMGNGTWGTITLMTGATSSANGSSGLVIQPLIADRDKYLKGDGTWSTPPGRDYAAGAGLSLANDTFSLSTSGATAGSYGPTANVTGNEGNTIKVPYVTVDAYGRVTSITEKTYTSKNTTYTAGTGLSLSGGAFSIPNSGATAGSYGPTANVTGNDGAAIKVPYVTVDAQGRVTAISEKTYTSKNTTYANMTAATSSAAGTAGLVPAPGKGKQNYFLRGDGTWVIPTNTTYSAGTGLSLSDGVFSLTNSGATAGSYGPTANVTGNEGNTIKVPYVTVDAQGRVTAISERTYTSKNTTYAAFTGATAEEAGTAGLVPKPSAGRQGRFLRGDGAWANPTNTTYTAGTGLSLDSTTFSLATSGATAGSYGPSSNVTGNDGATISVPYITVDAYGRITSIANKTYTSKNTDTNTTYTAGAGLSLSSTTFSLATSGATAGSYGPNANVTGSNGATLTVPYITVDKYGRVTAISNKTYTSVNTNTTYTAGNGLTLSGTTFLMSGTYTGTFTATQVKNAVWNDYAECREAEVTEGGYCVSECEDGVMKKTTGRLQSGCRLTSDTYGSCMGETEKAKAPIAVAGRVLAYPYRDRSEYRLGAAVCSGPDGTIDIMSREEIKEYPECIVGTVSEIPKYEIWEAGSKDNPHPIPVNGRIWVYVR